MSRLLVRPGRPGADGTVLKVTPESAGWTYVGFEILRLEKGLTVSRETGERELCLVMISGRALLTAAGDDLGEIGERMSPFDGPPWSAYVPANAAWSLVAAVTPVEIALCSAPAKGMLKARVIPPDAVRTETRGEGTNTRHVFNILPETEPAESLLVVEVLTPGGHWSSYPPHKHDRDALPEESLLEETYYHRIRPPQGFAFQRVYAGDGDLDETMAVSDGDVVLVPRGYHPVGAAHGYDLYYLNVMAGPKRTWRIRNDPAHEWLTA